MTEEENTFFLLIFHDTCGYFVQICLVLSSQQKKKKDGKEVLANYVSQKHFSFDL